MPDWPAPGGRGALVAAIYVAAYLAFSLPAVLAGLIAASAGLRPTAVGYATVVATLAVLAAAATARTTPVPPSVSPSASTLNPDPQPAKADAMHVTVTVIGTLGAAFAHAGHTVTFGVRAPAASPAPEGAPGTVTVRDIAAALADADVVVLAVPGPAVPDVVREHAAAFDGRLVIDATNTDGGAGPANSHAAVTAAAPGARYARAFNTLGVENLLDPRFAGQRADVFHTAPAVDRGTLAELSGCARCGSARTRTTS